MNAKRQMIMVMAAGLLAIIPVSVYGESRARAYTPEELKDQSTLIFEGVVTKIETVEKYAISFPTGAKLEKVLKGKTDAKEIALKYKHPGKYAFFPAEFSTPQIGAQGTFYVQDQSGTLVLIGYIAKPPADAKAGTQPTTQTK